MLVLHDVLRSALRYLCVFIVAHFILPDRELLMRPIRDLKARVGFNILNFLSSLGGVHDFMTEHNSYEMQLKRIGFGGNICRYLAQGGQCWWWSHPWAVFSLTVDKVVISCV